LRLASAATLAEGNALLPAFIADYNARFAKTAGQDSERRISRFRYVRRVPATALCLPCQRAEFDAAFACMHAQAVRYYADPRRAKPGEINHLHGGRGVYFDDPNGHLMEIITHLYGDPRADLIVRAPATARYTAD
jgi:catechol 2,3-dioxygenase-like lactoylglutathione lyase family enzyme